jgi:NAD(P)-dependent dehydrogenase (short-subunit alcohol dehydrogenase family)
MAQALSQQVIAVTGACSGMGLATAKQAALAGRGGCSTRGATSPAPAASRQG